MLQPAGKVAYDVWMFETSQRLDFSVYLGMIRGGSFHSNLLDSILSFINLVAAMINSTEATFAKES